MPQSPHRLRNDLKCVEWDVKPYTTNHHRDFRLLHYLRRNKLQLLYCSLSVYLLLFTTSYYLRSPILRSVFFKSLWSVIYKAINVNPQPALFRVTNIWRNAILSAVRCKSFAFYKVVWWHFSGVVGGGNSLFFSEITHFLKCVWIIPLKMTFGFPKVKWLQCTGKVGTCTSCQCQIFSVFNAPKIIKIS